MKNKKLNTVQLAALRGSWPSGVISGYDNSTINSLIARGYATRSDRRSAQITEAGRQRAKFAADVLVVHSNGIKVDLSLMADL